LHPDLIGVDHRRAIAVAEAMGAIGWKVNGAGGDGGSLTVVSPEGGAADLRRAFAEADARWQVLDLEPCAGGVTVVRRQGPPPPSAG
jgi:D-glycero-alpha-D-manno-heptose-7-phosphate kinase